MQGIRLRLRHLQGTENLLGHYKVKQIPVCLNYAVANQLITTLSV